MQRTLPFILIFAATAASAEQTRQLDAHEHGVGALNIAIDGSTVAMELHAPGADIVGFEYAAKTDADRAAMDNAVATLAKPLDLFTVPSAAGCSVTKASATLEMSDDDHDHDDHASESKDHDHDEHAHDEEHATHSEFHAEYMLTCADPSALTDIRFGYFDTFENAKELDVQIVTEAGAQAFDVLRDAPTLDLRSLF